MINFKEFLYLTEGSGLVGSAKKGKRGLVLSFSGGKKISYQLGQISNVDSFEEEQKVFAYITPNGSGSTDEVLELTFPGPQGETWNTPYEVGLPDTIYLVKKGGTLPSNLNSSNVLTYINSSLNSVLQSVVSTAYDDGKNTKIPDLKPSFFDITDINFNNVSMYIDVIKTSLDGKVDALGDDIVVFLKQLVDSVASNADFVDTSIFPDGLIPKYVKQQIDKYFGEILGPIKILSDPYFMPWISGEYGHRGLGIWLPSSDNYALVDYFITNGDIKWKISAKKVGGGNTVKGHDFLSFMDNPAEVLGKLAVPEIRQKFSILSRFDPYLEKLEEVLRDIAMNSIWLGPIIAASKLDIPRGTANIFSNILNIGNLESANFRMADIYREEKYVFAIDNQVPTTDKTVLGNIPSSFVEIMSNYSRGMKNSRNSSYVSLKHIYQAAGNVVARSTKEDPNMKEATRRFVELFVTDRVYYCFFEISASGRITWELKGRDSFENELETFKKIYLKASNDDSNKIGFHVEEYDTHRPQI